MHRNENDRKAQKAVNLTSKRASALLLDRDERWILDAKVTTYQDPKQGTVIELTWSNRFKDTKRYQVSDKVFPELDELSVDRRP